MIDRRTAALALTCIFATSCTGEITNPESALGGTQATRAGGGKAGRAAANGSGDSSNDEQTPELLTGTLCPDGRDPPLASGLTVREIAIYQTVKSTLYRDGSWLDARDIPVVQGKQALLRVFVSPTAGYQPHDVRAHLTLKTGEEETSLIDERTLSADSTDATADSTFNFLIEPAQLGEGTELSLALEEPDCEAESGEALAARVPESGAVPLAAVAYGKLRVVVVPVRVNGRVPLTDEAQLQKMRDYLLAYYPVSEVDLTVRAQPVNAPGTVLPTDGRSWSNLLNTIMATRASDRVGSDVYYYGLVQPAETARAYCARGCILGLAPQTVRVQASAQIALGASFADEQTFETLVHELGHAHGRGHSPCAPGNQIDGVDPDFPQADGAIGAWGWDARVNKLIAPNYKDIMGYCQPNWISGFTYAALAQRSLDVNERAFIQQPLALAGATRWHHMILYADGTARWGGAMELDTPGGELEAAQVLDRAGNPLAQIEVARIPLADTGDSFVYLPEPGKDWDRVVLKDRVIRLSDVLSAL